MKLDKLMASYRQQTLAVLRPHYLKYEYWTPEHQREDHHWDRVNMNRKIRKIRPRGPVYWKLAKQIM